MNAPLNVPLTLPMHAPTNICLRTVARLLPAFGLAVAIAAGADAAQAQTTNAPPPRLDVPYVPTDQETVNAMLDMAKVGPNDFLIDLGSGDGRIVVTAAKRGARGFGVDLNPQRIKEANENAERAKVTDKIKFYNQNLFDTKISDASVLTMYLLPSVNMQLRPRLFTELKPGTRVVSHDFDMGDWQPDNHTDLGRDQVFFWVIPAQVGGTWTLKSGNDSYKVNVQQKYQQISGAASGSKPAKLEGKLLGTEISFTLDGKKHTGRVDEKGNMSGTVDGGAKWSATKG
jgi:SAM-dependent methyltransferase